MSSAQGLWAKNFELEIDTMVSGSIPISYLILLFSVFGALFSFLIWRDSATRDLYDQENIIRKKHLDDPITVTFLIDGSPISLVIKINYIQCWEPDTSRQYRLKRAVYGCNGRTAVRLSMSWDRTPDELPELRAISLNNIISRHEDPDEFDGEIPPSGFGFQSLEIHSTRPKKVGAELHTFFQMVDDAIEAEIDELGEEKEISEEVTS